MITVDIQLTLNDAANAAGPVRGDDGVWFCISFRRSGQPVRRFPSTNLATTGSGKGMGYASVIPNTIQADNGAGLTSGIIGLCNKGQPRKLDDWGTLRAWAWGASRALDYFETDGSVDARQVGLEGHSRYGKATLVTMAYDQRFAIAYVSSSGEGGRQASPPQLR